MEAPVADTAGTPGRRRVLGNVLRKSASGIASISAPVSGSAFMHFGPVSVVVSVTSIHAAVLTVATAASDRTNWIPSTPGFPVLRQTRA